MCYLCLRPLNVFNSQGLAEKRALFLLWSQLCFVQLRPKSRRVALQFARRLSLPYACKCSSGFGRHVERIFQRWLSSLDETANVRIAFTVFGSWSLPCHALCLTFTRPRIEVNVVHSKPAQLAGAHSGFGGQPVERAVSATPRILAISSWVRKNLRALRGFGRTTPSRALCAKHSARSELTSTSTAA